VRSKAKKSTHTKWKIVESNNYEKRKKR